MARRATPPWLLFVTGTFIAYFLLLAYCDLDRPEDYGYRAKFVSGQLVISDIAAHPLNAGGPRRSVS